MSDLLEAQEMQDAKAVTRFWRSVDSRNGNDKCWPWLGYKDGDGYGLFYYRGRMRPAHELALTFTTGEVRLRNLDTCHSCDNPPCVNPAHLRFDTRLSNVRDMVERGRAAINPQKLTAEMVRELRERHAAGAMQKTLASQYGISTGEASMIVRGLRWKSAGGPIAPSTRKAAS